MASKIRWINENPGAARDEQGNWSSVEGRFSIEPTYRHTVNPDSYVVRDRLREATARFERVRDCKAWAEGRIVR